MVHQVRKARDSCFTKIAHFLGAILQILFVAVPKDLYRWLRLRRKCIHGQTVIITGGASGIGHRLAELFSEKGAKVAIIDQNLEGAERVAQGIVKRGGQARAWKCDIVNGKEIRKCSEEIKKHFGRLDIVICNAAILYFAHTLDLKDEEIQKALNVNVLGTINTIRAFLPHFESQKKGHIVAISSIAGFFGETFGMAYCPTKFAVRGAMDCLRMELSDRDLPGIVCTTICPFFVRTPMILDKGIRPISRWIPFMSVNRCAFLIMDAILKEKVIAFMPPWLGLMTMVNSLLSLNMQRIARNFINCRYEEVEKDEKVMASHQTNNKIRMELAKCPNNDDGDGELVNEAHQQQRVPKLMMKNRQMREHFELAGLFWWLLIPPAMVLTFLAFYNPEILNVPWLSVLGQFAYRMGIEHPHLILCLNIFAWAAHLLEAIFALYLTDSLHFSHKASFLWFVQTAILGFPSLRLLLKFWRKER